MPTSHTRLSIYNLAMDIVVEDALASPSENSPYARWLNRNYEHYVEVALQAHTWSFSMEFATLNRDGGFGGTQRWSYRYLRPVGALRLIPPTYRNIRGGQPIQHEVRGAYVYTNLSEDFDTEWVMRKLEPGEWDPLFAQVIAASLAEGMVHRFTRKTSFLDRAREMKREAIEAAEMVNAFEGDAQPVEQHDIIRVRSF